MQEGAGETREVECEPVELWKAGCAIQSMAFCKGRCVVLCHSSHSLIHFWYRFHHRIPHRCFIRIILYEYLWLVYDVYLTTTEIEPKDPWTRIEQTIYRERELERRLWVYRRAALLLVCSRNLFVDVILYSTLRFCFLTRCAVCYHLYSLCYYSQTSCWVSAG